MHTYSPLLFRRECTAQCSGAKCETDAQCSQGLRCAFNGACASNLPGTPCSSSSDCSSGICLGSICRKSADSSAKQGDWSNCTGDNQCENGCCSSQFSDIGSHFECTPFGTSCGGPSASLPPPSPSKPAAATSDNSKSSSTPSAVSSSSSSSPFPPTSSSLLPGYAIALICVFIFVFIASMVFLLQRRFVKKIRSHEGSQNWPSKTIEYKKETSKLGSFKVLNIRNPSTKSTTSMASRENTIQKFFNAKLSATHDDNGDLLPDHHHISILSSANTRISASSGDGLLISSLPSSDETAAVLVKLPSPVAVSPGFEKRRKLPSYLPSYLFPELNSSWSK